MCDTIVATVETTRDGVMHFGKNSDREPNEAQYLEILPAASHAPDEQLQCTYITIPQVLHTNAVLLSKPFWMWGAEMGVNEFGVAIGNEAVFSKAPACRENKLIGMDLLRLGLERAQSAAMAVAVITSLLEQYGQGGNCGFQHALYYHNSFLIADAKEAWVLETVDQVWAAKRVQGVYTISNCLTIGRDWDLAAPSLVDYAVDRGWCKNRADFDFARDYSDFLYTRFSDSRSRCHRSHSLLAAQVGKIDVKTMMAVLRSHGDSQQKGRLPDHGLSGSDICMHAGFGPIRGSQSTGSLVSYLAADHPLHFATGTSAPCTGIFKPIWLDGSVPASEHTPTGEYSADTLFWRHERLHRETLKDYEKSLSLYRLDRDALETRFIDVAFEARKEGIEQRNAITRRCFLDAEKGEAQWLERVVGNQSGEQPSLLYRTAWQQYNRQAKMPGKA